MIKLDRPILDAEDVFTACISRIRDQGLMQRMVDVTDTIVSASEEFDDAAAVVEEMRRRHAGAGYTLRAQVWTGCCGSAFSVSSSILAGIALQPSASAVTSVFVVMVVLRSVPVIESSFLSMLKRKNSSIGSTGLEATATRHDLPLF